MIGLCWFCAALGSFMVRAAGIYPIGELLQQVSQISDIATFNRMVDDLAWVDGVSLCQFTSLGDGDFAEEHLAPSVACFNNWRRIARMSPLTLGTSSGMVFGSSYSEWLRWCWVAQYSVWLLWLACAACDGAGLFRLSESKTWAACQLFWRVWQSTCC